MLSTFAIYVIGYWWNNFITQIIVVTSTITATLNKRPPTFRSKQKPMAKWAVSVNFILFR